MAHHVAPEFLPPSSGTNHDSVTIGLGRAVGGISPWRGLGYHIDSRAGSGGRVVDNTTSMIVFRVRFRGYRRPATKQPNGIGACAVARKTTVNTGLMQIICGGIARGFTS